MQGHVPISHARPIPLNLWTGLALRELTLRDDKRLQKELCT